MTRIIDLELDLHDRDTAELIKKYPLAKVESLLLSLIHISLLYQSG